MQQRLGSQNNFVRIVQFSKHCVCIKKELERELTAGVLIQQNKKKSRVSNFFTDVGTVGGERTRGRSNGTKIIKKWWGYRGA